MSNYTAWLEAFVHDQGAVAGTLHLRGPEHLELCAAVNIPEKVQEVTRQIPCGKGMAGLAWERDLPVTTCDLQSDETGDVRPGARAVQAAAAVALPIHESGGAFRGVVGIAFAAERDFTQADLTALQALACALPDE